MFGKNISNFKLRSFISLGIVSAIIVVTIALTTPNDRASEFEKLRIQLNSELSYSTLEKSSLNFSDKSSLLPVANYIIKVNERAGEPYPFKVMEYMFETGGMSLPKLGICDRLETIDRDNNKSLEEFLKDANIKVTAGLTTLQSDVDIAKILKRFLSKKPNRIDILVKGGADATSTDWTKNIDLAYNFTTENVFPPVNPKSRNPTRYSKTLKPINVSSNGKYKNNNLANLRAMFVVRDIIKETVIDGCLKSIDSEIRSKVHVNILEGYTGKEKNAGLRKAEVYLQIY
jgi:hypothetical protein